MPKKTRSKPTAGRKPVTRDEEIGGTFYKSKAKHAHCSQRTQLHHAVMVSEFSGSELKVGQQPISDRAVVLRKMRSKKKTATLQAVLEKFIPNHRHSLHRDYLEEKNVFFKWDSQDDIPFLNSLIGDVCLSLDKGFEIVDTMGGGQLHSATGTHVFTLVPRCKALKALGFRAQEEIEFCNNVCKHHTNTQRTRGKDGISTSPGTKYCCIGVTANQGGHGCNDNAFKSNPELRKDLSSFAKRREHLMVQYLSSATINGLQKSKELIGWNTLNKGDNGLFASLAQQADYTSPAHVDDDSGYSCFSVQTDNLDNNQTQYSMEAPVAHHFVFPTMGVAVAMRPGDVLFFNPLHYHCCSPKAGDYKDVPVFVSSLYLKTAVVGCNNNSVPLTQLQAKVLMMAQKKGLV